VHPEQQERVAAKVEEVVPHTDCVSAEDVLPDRCDLSFGLAARFDALGVRLRFPVRRRKCLAIDLPVRRERELVEEHPRRRNHVVGQSVLQEVSKLRRRGRGFPFGDHVGHKTLIPRSVLTYDSDRRFDALVFAQPRLDLAELDPEASQFDLVVQATEYLDIPVGQESGKVARSVEGCVAVTEEIFDEAIGRELRAVEVAVGDTGTSNVELSVDADRNRLPILVHDVELGVVDWASDQNRRVVSLDPVDGGPHGGLRGAVHVPELIGTLDELFRELQRHRFATAESLEGEAIRPARIDQHVPSRRRRLHDRRRGLAEPCEEPRTIGSDRATDKFDACADAQRQEELEYVDVEEIVVTASRASSAVMPGSRAIDCRKLTAARCGTLTPFGLPVDPEV